jgi:hypothetical protein
MFPHRLPSHLATHPVGAGRHGGRQVTALNLFADADAVASLRVGKCSEAEAAAAVVEHHYLHRRPPISHAFGLFRGFTLVGVCTYGVPASRHLQRGACPSNPDLVIELNRLWVHDECPKNTESWFVSRTLTQLPPRIVVSYADTDAGHVGYIYRALSWQYAGWTDMDRKTPRLDYIVPDGHTRDAFRKGYTHTVRRKPKVRYWTTTGSKSDKRKLRRLCDWPQLSWSECPPPRPGADK